MLRPRDYTEVDALITDTPGLSLVVFSADCGTILLYDPVHRAIGAVHAGWRGVAAGLASKTALKMHDTFGTEPGDLLCALGPAIGPCCFETDDDVPAAMHDALGAQADPFLTRRGAKWHIDLKAINTHWLKSLGVRHIDICPHCTACRQDLYWSHRKVGTCPGRADRPAGAGGPAMKIKRLLSLLLALGMLLTLLGCSGTGADADSNEIYNELADYYKQKEKNKNTTISSFSLPYLQGLTLDPVTCADGTQQDIGQLLYEGLVRLSLTLEPEPVLAESWSYDAASYTWTISLRSGVTFSDGSAFTASDAVATLRRAQSSARYAGRLSQVSSISASGSQTLTIRLSRPNSSFLSLLDIPIVKSGTEGQLVPTGTGRYTYVAASGSEGAYLTANTAWWQQQKLPMDRINLYTCKNSDTVSYRLLRPGGAAAALRPVNTASTGTVSSADFTDADTTVLHYLGFNTTRAPFNNADLRRAVSLGIDRAGCVSSFLMGHGTVAQLPVNPASPSIPRVWTPSIPRIASPLPSPPPASAAARSPCP
ncbi:MAG: peptidoglycan editing factor PgeF [Oscillospiraceae bacterium]